MEKWDLYNAKREKSGITVCRGEIIPKGLYHLSVSVWIVNQQGQYLLSQRHPKKQYPLYWECTGGSVLSGETSLQGAIREVKEELGILLTPGSEKLIYQSRRAACWLARRRVCCAPTRRRRSAILPVRACLSVLSRAITQSRSRRSQPVPALRMPIVMSMQ